MSAVATATPIEAVSTKSFEAPSNGKSSQTVNLEDFRTRFTAAIEQLQGAFIDRDDACRVLALASLTGNNALFVGDPGTGKSALIECFVKHFDQARFFDELCGSFTTLDQLVGPTDIKAFQKGQWNRCVDDMLPTAHVAFLDEVMKANDGTINSLLRILNERAFGGVRIPLRVLVAATNWPEVDQRTDNVEAMYDRFVLRLEVNDIPVYRDPPQGQSVDDAEKVRLVEMFADMLETEEADDYVPATRFTIDELDAAVAAVGEVTIERQTRLRLGDIRRRLAADGVHISSRRAKKMQNVLSAQAWLSGSDTVTLEHFDVLAYGFWIDRPHIEIISGILDSIDLKVVSECVKLLDDARTKCASLLKQSKAQRRRQATSVIEAMTAAAEGVHKILETEGCTERGRQRIADEMQKMRDAYSELKASTEIVKKGGS